MVYVNGRYHSNFFKVKVKVKVNNSTQSVMLESSVERCHIPLTHYCSGFPFYTPGKQQKA